MNSMIKAGTDETINTTMNEILNAVKERKVAKDIFDEKLLRPTRADEIATFKNLLPSLYRWCNGHHALQAKG